MNEIRIVGEDKPKEEHKPDLDEPGVSDEDHTNDFWSTQDGCRLETADQVEEFGLKKIGFAENPNLIDSNKEIDLDIVLKVCEEIGVNRARQKTGDPGDGLENSQIPLETKKELLDKDEEALVQSYEPIFFHSRDKDKGKTNNEIKIKSTTINQMKSPIKSPIDPFFISSFTIPIILPSKSTIRSVESTLSPMKSINSNQSLQCTPTDHWVDNLD